MKVRTVGVSGACLHSRKVKLEGWGSVLPCCSCVLLGGLNVFHHDFKLCFVGGDAACVCAAVGTGDGCGFAKGELDEAGRSDAIVRTGYPGQQLAIHAEIPICEDMPTVQRQFFS